jgi:outer membrane protein OmpA-like peptidoglycan-associated protein
VLVGSFPIVTDRWYFRLMLGASNFDRTDSQAQRFDLDRNAFLGERLYWFEPEVVYTPFPGSSSRVLPYVFTGFGALLADPFSSDRRRNQPDEGTPGPERTVFALPLGAGVDLALSRHVSIFAEASYRFNFNYALSNEGGGANPHNTSLVLAGLRVGLDRRDREVRYAPPPPLPPPAIIPPYEPPIARPTPIAQECSLIELNTVYFGLNSTTLNAEARALLDANVQALRFNPLCCLDVIGYADRGEGVDALRVSRARAQAVLDYYLEQGIGRERISVGAAGREAERCGKEKDGDCAGNRRVESVPGVCRPAGG